ncbi:PREDICTED: uncharacterized protein LOC106740622 isoform X1 [Dinoponera quadriceps]|uniref:Uncharacterized protein LOC106740622 isoform X1 n=1 Tax=Dinoponera quadriceps TaxID=609295 RepID=A0A6P3WNB9_DINQU|nr:PREDICTED: uncharacterized protein LOC106740622 isoform X1 [Dinoponera quadriceps]
MEQKKRKETQKSRHWSSERARTAARPISEITSTSGRRDTDRLRRIPAQEVLRFESSVERFADHDLVTLALRARSGKIKTERAREKEGKTVYWIRERGGSSRIERRQISLGDPCGGRVLRGCDVLDEARTRSEPV